MPLCTPAGNVIGVMELINAQRSPNVVVPFAPECEPLARAFASLAAVAVHRSILDEATFKDTLTDLYNRRYLGLRLEEEAGRHKRFGHPVSVVSVDLDDFDRVNRRAGQPGGDAVLREIGVLLRKNTRKFTVVARDRGDDFTIVLSNTTRAGATVYAERIRQIIARHPSSTARSRPASAWPRCPRASARPRSSSPAPTSRWRKPSGAVVTASASFDPRSHALTQRG